jgi:hypothetical protein
MARYFKNDGKIYLACQSSNQIKAFIYKTKKIMPKLSERAKLLKQLNFLIQMEILDMDDSEDDEESFSTLDDLVSLQIQLKSIRCLQTSAPIPKDKSLREIFWRYPDREFRQIVRMNKRSFARLVEVVQTHPVFCNSARNYQEEPAFQLLVVLSRLGCYGNGASLGRNARMAGVSSGTVCKYTDRVFTAILCLHDQFIRWPDQNERLEISRRFAVEYGLPGAVGIVDGTHICFEQKPHIDGEVYFSRKSRYSINLQLICDDKKRITFYQTGWPGSVGDSTIFDESHLCKQPELYFSNDEFLLADAGYGAKAFICTPYKHPMAIIPHNQLFNTLFSSARVHIEHLNGLLKGRFCSLKGLRTQVKKVKDYDKINKWIVVCLILYNMMIDFRDEEFPIEPPVIDDDEDERTNIDAANGNQLRIIVQHRLLTWYYNQII